jgi:hypothetical protein
MSYIDNHIPETKHVSMVHGFAAILQLKFMVHVMLGHAVVQLVEALRYKPEGRGFDCRWCH